MKTQIRTTHEEVYNNEKDIGVLTNFDLEGNYVDSFAFIYNKETETYVFFNTILDMFNYLMYGGDDKINRAYLKEETFDELYDAEELNSEFKMVLDWLDLNG